MTFQYIKSSNSLREKKPKMAEPNYTEFENGEREQVQYHYEKKPKQYPCLPGNWEEKKEYVEGKDFEVYDSDKWFWAECEKCGWQGSSGKLEGGGQIADTGDYSEPNCPKCHSTEIEVGNDGYLGIVASLLTPSKEEGEETPLTAILKKLYYKQFEVIDVLRYSAVTWEDIEKVFSEYGIKYQPPIEF